MRVGDKYYCKKEYITSKLFAEGNIYVIESIYDRVELIDYNEYEIGSGKDSQIDINFRSDFGKLCCFSLTEIKGRTSYINNYFQSLSMIRRKKLEKLGSL